MNLLYYINDKKQFTFIEKKVKSVGKDRLIDYFINTEDDLFLIENKHIPSLLKYAKSDPKIIDDYLVYKIYSGVKKIICAIKECFYILKTDGTIVDLKSKTNFDHVKNVKDIGYDNFIFYYITNNNELFIFDDEFNTKFLHSNVQKVRFERSNKYYILYKNHTLKIIDNSSSNIIYMNVKDFIVNCLRIFILDMSGNAFFTFENRIIKVDMPDQITKISEFSTIDILVLLKSGDLYEIQYYSHDTSHKYLKIQNNIVDFISHNENPSILMLQSDIIIQNTNTCNTF